MKRLIPIPIIGSSQHLFNKSNTLLAKGYNRVVIGKRGPYVECTKDQIVQENLFVPPEQKYRFGDARVYYIEYRTKDSAFTKVYYQLKTVKYADYKLYMFYFSPDDLLIPKPVDPLIETFRI